jgi:hypothetical protein
MRPLAVVVLLAAAACGSPVPPGWQGSDVHAVDGIWLGAETPCTTGPKTVCGALVREATRRLTLDDRTHLTGAAVAQLPTLYQLSNGGLQSFHEFIGVEKIVAVVLDIGASRRVVGLMCSMPNVLNSDGACNPLDGVLDLWRVGAPEPTMYRSPG